MSRAIFLVLLAATLRGGADPVPVGRLHPGAPRAADTLPWAPASDDGRSTPSPAAVSVPIEQPTIPPVVSVPGYATWYATGPGGMTAAAGPVLRALLGAKWRGQHVRVCSGTCIVVRLIDWCACGPRHGLPTLLDLSDEAFAALSHLSRGVLRVSVVPA